MATLREIIDALDNYIETAAGLGLNCIRGEPDFARPALAPPICALLYTGSAGAGEARRRVGAGSTMMVVTLQVYATDEVNLFSLAEKLHAMRQRGWITLSAGDDSQPVKIRLNDDERIPAAPEDPKEIRHAVACPVAVSYE